MKFNVGKRTKAHQGQPERSTNGEQKPHGHKRNDEMTKVCWSVSWDAPPAIHSEEVE